MNTLERLKYYPWINRRCLETMFNIPKGTLRPNSKRSIPKKYLDLIELEFNKFEDPARWGYPKQYDIDNPDVEENEAIPIKQPKHKETEQSIEIENKLISVLLKNNNSIVNTLNTYPNNTNVYVRIGEEQIECYTKGKEIFSKEDNQRLNVTPGIRLYINNKDNHPIEDLF